VKIFTEDRDIMKKLKLMLKNKFKKASAAHCLAV